MPECCYRHYPGAYVKEQGNSRSAGWCWPTYCRTEGSSWIFGSEIDSFPHRFNGASRVGPGRRAIRLKQR